MRFSALPARPGARRVDDDHVRRPRALVQLLERLADVAGEERGVAIPFRSAFSSAHATDSSEISTPQTVSAFRAIERPIVPVPQ